MATSIAATTAASTTAQLRFLTDAAHLLRQTAPETSAYLLSRRTDVLAQNSALPASSSSTTAANSIAASAQVAIAFTQTDAQRQHVCTCCGHILIPGCNGTTLAIEPGRKTAKRKRDGKDGKDEKNKKPEKTDRDGRESHTGITKVFACGACSRETRIALPPPPPLPRNRRPKKPAAKGKEEVAKPALEGKGAPIAPVPAASSTVSPAETAPAAKSTNASSKKRAKNRKAGLLALLDKRKGAESSGGFGGLGLSFDDFRKK